MKKYTLYILIALLLCNFATAGNIVPLKKSNHSLAMTSKKDLDNVQVCALRVEFQQDDKDVTTGDGTFLYEAETTDTLNSRFKVDPVPHNRAYFYDHIRSLANFYDHVSNGNLTIDLENSEVYPLKDSETFTLSREMDYYHPFLEEDSIDIRLAELFIEAVSIADEAVDFADYDVVVIFHAGVGQDFSFDLDITPYDIPSAYLNADDIKKAMGDQPNFQGVSVDDGNTFLNECIILPETQNHTLYERWDEVFNTDNAFDYQIGLNGTFAFMFGFYLGIPGMYNTETGAPGAGRWEMMDQGSVNLNGLVPAMPNAWIREYMGWIEPVEAKTSTPVNLAHAESASDTLAWKIQIDEDEYFLVENRNNFLRPGWNLDSIRNAKYEAGPEDANFPSVLPLVKDSIGAEISEETGVLLSVPRYDVGLPGSGLLIWHIDESVINANLSTNSVNNDRERKGVHLEEGDGAVDIGFPAANIFSDVHNGWGYDAWFAANEGFWDVNKNVYPENDENFVGFTEHTFPNTNSNDYMPTGIRIDSIGAGGEVMNFTISFADQMGVFPVDLQNYTTKTKHRIYDYNNDGYDEIIVVTDKIYLYDGNGNLISSCDYIEDYDQVGRVELSLSQETIYLTIATSQQTVVVQQFSIEDDGEFELENEINIDEAKLLTNTIVFNDELVFASDDNIYQVGESEYNSLYIDIMLQYLGTDGTRIYGITADGNLYETAGYASQESHYIDLQYNEEMTVGMALGYLDDNELLDIVIASDKKLYLYKNDFEELISTPIDCYSNIAISDVDGNGHNDIIVSSEDHVYALDDKLVLIQNFPFELPALYNNISFNNILLTSDIDNNEETQEILTFVGDGLFAINQKGNLVDNFPVAMIAPVQQQAACYNVNGSSYFLSIGNKQINRIELSNKKISETAWGSLYGNTGNFFYDYKPSISLEFSDNLLIKKKTFCWPNPVEENESYIRYFVTEACDVTVNIFNMAGQHIKTFNQSDPQVNRFNEISWHVANVQSGVYFAIVKAETGGTTETKTVKIMVIK